MPDAFHDGNRRLQDLFDTRRLADHCVAKLVRDSVSAKQKAFIESCDMFFLATADEQGRPTCSYKGGEPGFVRVPDEHVIAFPNYNGDGKYLSWGNVLKNPQVALLFIDFMKGWRLRVHGTAAVAFDDPLAAQYPGAQFVVRVTPREVFGNCPRYVHKYQLVEHSAYTPRAGIEPPVPEWKKQLDWNAVLPAHDPARRPS
jgi:predicted pyridoxine 5'-phosphate oxidase superfamily flavin-nucleotide-binding protein